MKKVSKPSSKQTFETKCTRQTTSLKEAFPAFSIRPSEEVIQDLPVCLTSHFQIPEAYTFLKEEIFPKILKNRDLKKPLRIWIPGCSTGEEVYSIAIALYEFLESKHIKCRVQIFGTDIAESCIQKAQAGVYSEKILKEIPRERLRLFFIKTAQGYKIVKHICDMCIFERQDITKDPPLSDMDLIICQNVLISMDALLPKRILSILHDTLKPEGCLMFGPSEAAWRSMGLPWEIAKLKEAENGLRRDRESFERLVHEKSEELLMTQKKLADSKRLSDLGGLAAIIAHELRNPLSVIRTATYNIKKKRQNPLIDKHLENIEKNLSESTQIINNLLFYSRIKLPGYKMTNIDELLNESIFSVKERYETKQISITKDLGAIQNLSIKADPLQMKEVFTNILNNACDAIMGSEGKIEIWSEYEGKDFIKLYFKDNGSGINREDIKNIFEPFFSTKPGGIGLGLTVCSQIVHLHSGQIEIESEKGKETTVITTLPIGLKTN